MLWCFPLSWLVFFLFQLDCNLLSTVKNCTEMLKLWLLDNLGTKCVILCVISISCVISVPVIFKVRNLGIEVKPLTEAFKLGIYFISAWRLAGSCSSCKWALASGQGWLLTCFNLTGFCHSGSCSQWMQNATCYFGLANTGQFYLGLPGHFLRCCDCMDGIQAREFSRITSYV